ncbi:MAG: D-cysteine desulfhydrase family protein [Congregibacter sp.]
MSALNRRQLLQAASATALLGALGGCASSTNYGGSFDTIPRVRLTQLPTPCKRMDNLSKLLGRTDLFVKRDDVMELAHGGNKTRKLEYVLAQALNRESKAVVTQGGLQSNHVRQTCSGAAKLGLEAHVILSNPVPEMKDALMGSGNYLMSELMGANIYLAEDGRAPVVERVMSELTAAGKNPYNIPAGASSGIGSLGYMNAARELITQWDDMGIAPSHVFTASGSCGTQAGLLMGLRYFGNTSVQVVGVAIARPRLDTEARARRVLNMICDETGIDRSFIPRSDIVVTDAYIGDGYGRPTNAGIAAMKTVAEREGIILDPVYTGKCMSAMLDMLRTRSLQAPKDLVFLHTGGAPAIHPYAEYLRS